MIYVPSVLGEDKGDESRLTEEIIGDEAVRRSINGQKPLLLAAVPSGEFVSMVRRLNAKVNCGYTVHLYTAAGMVVVCCEEAL